MWEPRGRESGGEWKLASVSKRVSGVISKYCVELVIYGDVDLDADARARGKAVKVKSDDGIYELSSKIPRQRLPDAEGLLGNGVHGQLRCKPPACGL